MGAANSSEPRSVSMDNPSGVIDVSDDVVKRLKKGINKQAAHEEARAAPPPPPPKKEARDVPIKKVLAAKPAPPPPAPTVIYQNAPPVYMAPGGQTITAADMRRQKEVELQQNDTQWRQRMQQLEETLKKTNFIMENEYSAAVEDVRKRFATAAPAHQLPPCQDLKAQVIACYRANPGETLKCSEEVAQFRNCVSMNRIKKLDAEEEKTVAASAAAAKPAKAA